MYFLHLKKTKGVCLQQFLAHLTVTVVSTDAVKQSTALRFTPVAAWNWIPSFACQVHLESLTYFHCSIKLILPKLSVCHSSTASEKGREFFISIDFSADMPRIVQLITLSFRKKKVIYISFITKTSFPSAEQIAQNGTNICVNMLAATKPPHCPMIT